MHLLYSTYLRTMIFVYLIIFCLCEVVIVSKFDGYYAEDSTKNDSFFFFSCDDLKGKSGKYKKRKNTIFNEKKSLLIVCQ